MPGASLGAGLATGLGALPMLVVRDLSQRLQDLMRGFAAGVMLFDISHEIVPETQRQGPQELAVRGPMSGLVVMMVLDASLG